MKKSFSLIELVIVIVVIGILYSSVNFSLNDSSLNQAAHQLVSHINYTRHLALKDNKMQYYPINSSATEMNRSKYWFKQWWQIRISTTDDNEYWYEIFSDSPNNNTASTNFDKRGDITKEYAIDPQTNLYMAGNYESPESLYKKLNLSYTHSIVKILVNGKDSIYSNNSFTLIFDNYGNCYLSEGDKGDGGDINPYDTDKRIPLLTTAKITLCQDDNCEKNISICVSPKIGNAYVCD
jgi:prepilin-type N-terminal cleavage/methylation domain-containing protein